ncbi:hypothetical protein [Winogradskyella haliclonae]|nr:hypothetical protein [Winogradskyella haliclonae]
MNNESLRRGFPIENNKLLFIMTEGYKNRLDNNVKHIFINNCPFCGTDLKSFYNDGEFINEDNHDW